MSHDLLSSYPKPLNPDCFSNFSHNKEDVKELKPACQYLYDVIIPQVVSSFIKSPVVPIGSFRELDLTEMLHRKGVRLSLSCRFSLSLS